MTHTDNLNLNKPERAEQFNIDHWNENSDIVDAAITAETERATTAETELQNTLNAQKQDKALSVAIENSNTVETTLQALSANKQPKQLTQSISVVGQSTTTVETALQALATRAIDGNLKQPKQLESPIYIDGENRITVESAIQALNSAILGVSTLGNLDMQNGVLSATPRWLRFSPTNKKALVIKKNTIVKVGTHYFMPSEDTTFDLTEQVTDAGKDYFVQLCYSNDNWTLIASTTKTADTDSSRYIGR